METPVRNPVPPSQLGALAEGLALLRKHPWTALGLVLLAVLLGQLGPALELLAGATDNRAAQVVLGFAALLPLELYALPRWLAHLDAEGVDDPSNPASGWRPDFERRWLPAFAAKMLVLVLGALGCGLILPGLVIFTFFGWAPTRMLLRGDRLGAALRWSGRAMLRTWPRIVQAALLILAIWMLGQLLIGLALGPVLPQDPQAIPDALLRLRHPAFWIAGAINGLLYLWISAAFLALYHRLERLVQTSASR